jgi:probable rRNA maturation factor
MITIDPPSSSRADPPLNKSALTRFLNRARAAVGLSGDVHVLLTSDSEIRRLNKAFRRKNEPTDILSFPTPPEMSDDIAGDLAISLDTAQRQAARFGHTLRDEVRVLLLHGTLHLAGFDHEADSGEMAAREAELRRELKVTTGLIARAGAARTRTEADPSAALRNEKKKRKQQRRRRL